MSERARTFVGVDPRNGDEVLVTIYEDDAGEAIIIGVELATRTHAHKIWSIPTTMSEVP